MTHCCSLNVHLSRVRTPHYIVKTMLVFYVRGLFSDLEFPYAQFACKSLSGDLLFSPFWEAVYRLERMGLKVIAATGDDASPNRKFFRLHSQISDEADTRR